SFPCSAPPLHLHSFPTRRSSDLEGALLVAARRAGMDPTAIRARWPRVAEIAFTSERKKMSTLHAQLPESQVGAVLSLPEGERLRSEEHTSELQSLAYLVCRLLLE